MTPSIGYVSSPVRRAGLLAALVAVALASASSVAHADRAKAKAYYDDAEKQYNLGKFDTAVDLYTKAYEEWPEPSFLFNLAQAYRQAGNCKQALFFYRRFLSLKSADQVKPIAPGLKTEVEARIKELEECVTREIASKPPETNMNPDSGQNGSTGTSPGNTQVASTGGDDDGEDAEIVAPVPAYIQPTTVIVRAIAGGSQLFLPGLDDTTVVPLQFGFALTAGYPVPVAEKVTLDFGATINFMPIPIADAAGDKHLATLFGVLANAGATVALSPKLGLHFDLGLGLVHIGGLKDNTSLTDGMTDSTNMFGLRLGLSGEYALTPNVFGVLTVPAVTFSPAGSGLNDDASAVLRFDFLVGAGYRI
jgi:hypothetical protein